MRLIEAKRNKSPSPRPIILNDALPHWSRMEAIPDNSCIFVGRFILGWMYCLRPRLSNLCKWHINVCLEVPVFFSWNVTEIPFKKIPKCQCLAIVETCLHHRFSSPIFLHFPLPVFWPKLRAISSFLRRIWWTYHIEEATILEGFQVVYIASFRPQPIRPARDVQHPPDVGPTQRCTKMYKFSLFTQKKNIYIYINIYTKFPTHNYHLDYRCLCCLGFHFFFKNLILVAFLSSFWCPCCRAVDLSGDQC